MIAKDSVVKFVAYWLAQAGSERSQCHQFWDSLLGEVLGVIVGFSVDSTPRKKRLFTDGIGREVDNISPYLVEGPNDFVAAAKEPELEKWIRPYVGAEEFINAKKRHCLELQRERAAIEEALLLKRRK